MRIQKRTHDKSKDLEPIFKPEANKNFHLVSEQGVEIKSQLAKKKKQESAADIF